MKYKEVSKAVTARFPMQDYLLLQQEAEKRGCTIADVVRKSWTKYQEQHQFQQLLLRLEQRQRKTTFEMMCIIIGLKSDEREQALQQLQKIGVKW